PFSVLFAALSACRRALYRIGILRSSRVAVPVIVVGNISVGGTGKTPVTIWLAKQLRTRGLNPGIASRGYGGVIGDTPAQVNANSDADIVGDEPLLIARRTGCPVVVHPNRAAAARELIAMGVNIVITDDGLQHYKLQRDFEIAVVDGARGLGNGWMLPAGPLREAGSRLFSVDRVLVHLATRSSTPPASVSLPISKSNGFHLVGHELLSVDGQETRTFDQFAGKTVHAVAAIGNPERFFQSLERRGMNVVRHPFPDHAQFTSTDLVFDDEFDIVMTEKDAVKCGQFATTRYWYVPVDVEMHDDEWVDALVRKLLPDAKQEQQ
ncbi:MAG: tetraacyldisaccharide 4'-kinase, partial [Woeseia sp.]